MAAPGEARLKRALTLWDLVFYGVVIIQPTAPMSLFGVVSVQAKGHVVTTLLIGLVGMLLTAISYGRMARAYPSAGSAFTYVGQSIHPSLGYVTGWSMVMDYVLNPLVCTIVCTSLTVTYFPWLPRPLGVIFFAALFTVLNLQGVKTSARSNQVIGIGLCVVVLLFLGAAVRFLMGQPLTAADLTRPFYDPATFSFPLVLTGASIACLTYIGFDGISTLSEEVENPRRNIMLATVITCLVIGVLATLQVYAAQLVWGKWDGFTLVDTAFVEVARKAGGPFLFGVVGGSLLIATIGSGSGALLGAARLLYGMGRSSALPRGFFGYVNPQSGIPSKNVVLVGCLALLGGLTLDLQLGFEMLNFGAFIAFMGVNLAVFFHYWLGGREKGWSYLVLPLLGFLLCGYLWYGLRWQAKLAGGAWLLVGMLYGAVRTNGFRGKLLSFEPPPES